MTPRRIRRIASGVGAVLCTLCAACATPDAASPVPESFVDRVIEDVTAMIEGMARAHRGDQVVQQAPGFRSRAPAGGTHG